MITNKEDFFGQLDFMTAQKRPMLSAADVTVKVVQGSKKANGGHYFDRLSITFRNGILDLLGDGDRVSIARYKNRLIIVKDPRGIKLSDHNEKGTLFVRWTLNDRTLSTYGWFEGNYDLKYDDLYEYYFIEKDASAANVNASQE